MCYILCFTKKETHDLTPFIEHTEELGLIDSINKNEKNVFNWL